MIAIITYDRPHRKTQDVITKLLLNGYSELHLVVIPWVKRKNFKPIFQHRPSQCVDISVAKLSDRLNLTYSKVEVEKLNQFFTEKNFDHILIAGAGLLPPDLATHHYIINAHPGYLPNVKGLDALKWAIYEGQTIGVTTHYISDQADEGALIEKKFIPIYYEDTFHSLAYRVYENEIEMMAHAVKLIDHGEAPLESLSDDRYHAHKRMPHHHELIMMDRFEELRRKSFSSRDL